ncbi:MAG TPA: sialidase family protein [Actinophytocola sp.]|nr:sialidase family protein [Actinophytocola sp.]
MEITIPAQPIGVGTNHSAFPGMVRRPEGVIELVWRQGTDHFQSRDGRIMRAVSRNNGTSYAEVTHLRVAASGTELRDPSISYARGAHHMTMFTASASAPARAGYAIREWGDAVRVDPGLPYAAMCSPVVELPDGRLGAPFYGRQAGESIDTAWMGWSVDHGKTWTTNRIANSIGAGVAHNEPWLVVDGTQTHFFYRWGQTDGIGLRTTPDSGATWGGPRKILNQASGRPTTLRTGGGVLVMVYRKLPTRAAAIAYSTDHTATWQDGGVLMEPPASSPNGMTYAAMAETAPGVVHVVFGMEHSATSSVLYGAGLTV